ncbi:MAG: aspartate aminotransferase family protein [Phycisphaerales bacterium]|nr:aspartate aminotransferase family protein [Phycisphaerales bacterium]
MDRTEGDVNRSPARDAWQAEHLDAGTRHLLAADERAFLRQSLSTPCLNALRRADGPWIEDTQGRRYLDFHGNSAHQIGYGHPKVIEAVERQLRALPFCPRRYANRPALELAERLAALAPGNLSKCLFAPGGTLAIGIALKLARAATGRHKTIAFRGSFHGASLDAASVGGEDLFHARMGPLMPGALHVQPPAAPACSHGCPGGRACDGACAAEIEELLAREGDIAAVIAEPVRATTVAIPPAEYWRRVRAACDRHGTLLIFDEIPTGLGRTGRMFACEHFGVVPDILVLGKGLGGGVMPMAAVVARPELDIAPELALGHYTHEKSPLGAAAALATLDVIEEERLVERSHTLGEHALARLRELLTGRPGIAECRGLGLMLGVEHAAAGPDSAEAAAERTMYRCLSAGLSYKVGGGRVATLFPPLTIADAELGTAMSVFADASTRD